jgi:hypothetical protein
VAGGVISTALPDVDETTTLLESPTISRSRSRSRRRRTSISRQGTATVTQAVLMACFAFSCKFEDRLTFMIDSCLNPLLEPVCYFLERRRFIPFIFYGCSDQIL